MTRHEPEKEGGEFLAERYTGNKRWLLTARHDAWPPFCLRLPFAAWWCDRYVLPASRISLLSRLLVCRLETASLHVSKSWLFAASPHLPIFAAYGDVDAHETHAVARSLHRMLAHPRIAPPHAKPGGRAHNSNTHPPCSPAVPAGVNDAARQSGATGTQQRHHAHDTES